MKNNLTYFSFAILIIAGIGFTSIWKKNSSNVTIEKNLDIQIDDNTISTINESDENQKASLNDKNNNTDAITYKDEYPVLTYLSRFSEAFSKARELNSENFWFNEELYHTKLKEDPFSIKESNKLSDSTNKENTLGQIP